MPNSWKKEDMQAKRGVHHAGLVERMVNDHRLQRDKFWDRDSMFVTMPDAAKSLHITRVKRPEAIGYRVEPAEPSCPKTQRMLANAPVQPNEDGLLSQYKVGQLISHCRQLQLTRSAPEGADAPVRGR